MKKFLLSITMMLMSVVSLQAQSLDGIWLYVDSEGDNVASLALNFQAQDPVIQQLYIEMVDETAGVVGYLFKAPPIPFVRQGNTLTLNFDVNKAGVTLQKAEWSDQIKQKIAEDPSLESQYQQVYLKVMEDQKGAILQDAMLSGNLEIVSVTDKDLVLKDESGETYEFYKHGTR